MTFVPKYVITLALCFLINVGGVIYVILSFFIAKEGISALASLMEKRIYIDAYMFFYFNLQCLDYTFRDIVLLGKQTFVFNSLYSFV